MQCFTEQVDFTPNALFVIGGATFESLRETENSEFGTALYWFVPAGKMSECHGNFYILSNSVSHVIVLCNVVHVDWVTE